MIYFLFFIGYETFLIVSCLKRHLTAGLIYNDFVHNTAFKWKMDSFMKSPKETVFKVKDCWFYW